MNFRWLMRAAIWVRRPPSWRKVKMFAALIAVCIAIGLVEYMGFWPEWAKLDRPPRAPRF